MRFVLDVGSGCVWCFVFCLIFDSVVVVWFMFFYLYIGLFVKMFVVGYELCLNNGIYVISVKLGGICWFVVGCKG